MAPSKQKSDSLASPRVVGAAKEEKDSLLETPTPQAGSTLAGQPIRKVNSVDEFMQMLADSAGPVNRTDFPGKDKIPRGDIVDALEQRPSDALCRWAAQVIRAYRVKEMRGADAARLHNRARCSVCQQDHALTVDGKIWGHVVNFQQCPGAARPPVSKSNESPNAFE